MNEKKKLLILAAVLILTVAAALVLYNSLSKDDTPDVSADGPVTAPDFTVFDADGNAVKLSDYRGKPVILNFWSTTCPPCRQEMPDLDSAFDKYGKEIQFLIVNLPNGNDETVASASEFIDEQGYGFPVFFDTAYSAAQAYAVTSIPRTYFINGEGKIVTYKIGLITESQLQNAIKLLLP